MSISISLRNLPKGTSGNKFYSSSHFGERSKLKKDFITYITTQGFFDFIAEYKAIFEVHDTVSVKIEINKPGSWDCDNIGYLICKFFNDSLKTSRAIVDDSHIFIDDVRFKYSDDIEPNSALITITKSKQQHEARKATRLKNKSRKK